jgi:acetolactate synthase-1/2/3 large subunit
VVATSEVGRIGEGGPGGLAALLLARRDAGRRVLALSGDGGFLMNVQELQTAVEQKLPFVNLIFRDDGYGLVAWKQIIDYGRESHTRLTNPDLVRLAESFGCKGYRVTAAEELAAILKDALSQDVPTVIDCPVDYSENLKLTERLGVLVCPIQSDLAC